METQSTSNKVINMLAKPVENAALVYLGSKLLGISGNSKLPLIGNKKTDMNLALVAGVSSLATETVHNYILPLGIDSSAGLTSAGMLLNPLLQIGISTAIVAGTDLNTLNNVKLPKMALLFGGAEIGAQYINSGFVQPWLNSMN